MANLKEIEKIIRSFKEFECSERIITRYNNTYEYYSSIYEGLYINIKYSDEVGVGLHITIRNKFVDKNGKEVDYVLNTVEKNRDMRFKTGYIKKSSIMLDRIKFVIKDGINNYKSKVLKLNKIKIGEFEYYHNKKFLDPFDRLLKNYSDFLNTRKKEDALIILDEKILSIWKKIKLDIDELNKMNLKLIKSTVKNEFLKHYNIDFDKY